MYIKSLTKLHRDNTGNTIDLYTILVSDGQNLGVLEYLYKYQIRYLDRSASWHKKLIQIVGMLLDYMEANASYYDTPVDLCGGFVDAVYDGTIDETGVDMSQLYWLPKTTENANQLLEMLNDFSDWVYQIYGTIQLNPWLNATDYQERINWIAHINRNTHSFLKHLDKTSDASEISKKVRSVLKRNKTVSYEDEKISFPQDMVFELLFNGFKKKKIYDDILDQYNWRDICITILLVGGGIRLSEAFHIWVSDIYPDPYKDKVSVVRIYHPRDGKAPQDLKNIKTGRYITDRASYLSIKYGMIPRNMYPPKDNRFAGWKNPRLDSSSEKYMHVFWRDDFWGKLFYKSWEMYLKKRLKENVKDDNPYAFVCLSKNEKGNILTINSFRDSYKKAIEKIGLKYGKKYGTTPHAHRHAYAKALLKMNFEDNSILTRALHHKSEESKNVYTQLSIDEISKIMNLASTNIENPFGIKKDIDLDLESFIQESENKWKRINIGKRKK
ncbi:MAG: site-specific integrase [Eubacterium sp.]|nr:site-specific integrase [Eubacterium sp.]